MSEPTEIVPAPAAEIVPPPAAAQELVKQVRKEMDRMLDKVRKKDREILTVHLKVTVDEGQELLAWLKDRRQAKAQGGSSGESSSSPEETEA